MRLMSRRYLCFLVLITLVGITYSSDSGTATEGRRQSRVSGRIVKLYSGPKPDPILCLGEGFQADAADCSVFYRCLKASNGKYTVYRFQCGPGTIYDPETEICNHPRSTKRSECRGLGNDKLISSTKGYMENEIDELHEDNKELPSPISTKLPTVTNAVVSTVSSWKPDKLESSYITTSYPWFTHSNNLYGESTTTSASSHIIVSSKNPTDYTTSSSYVTRKPISLNDIECMSDGFMGDTIDCRKFYRCVNNQRGGFIRYEFSCSETTIWDDDTQGCNHPWAVRRRRCGKGNTYDENSISHINQFDSNKIILNKPVQQQTQISYGSEVTQSQIQISNGPVIQNQTQINYGDRINQEKHDVKQNQTQISNGSAVSQSQTQINYGDKVTQTQVQIDHSHQSSQTQTQITQFSSTIATTATSTQHNIKDNNNSQCMKDGFMGDSNDCKKFYRCTNNGRGGFDRHEFSCSEGTLWDKNLEACNHDWAVTDCGEKHSIQKIPPMNTYYTTTSSSFNNEIEDEIGYINQNNVPEVEQLTQSPSTLTISTLTTMTTESKQTTELKSYETDCTSSGFFGNANDCAKFYRCVENSGGRFTKYEYKCGDGTLWDPEIESCNHAWTVKHCGNALQKLTTSVPTSTESKIITTVSLIQTTTQKNINDDDYDSGYGSLQRETPSQSTTTTERISYEGTECKTSGFMGDNNDCKKFYRCVENSHGNYTRYEFSCGEGTVWDPEIEACNHASDVEKCGGSAMNNNINKITTTHPVSEYSSESDNGYVTHSNDETENSQYTTIRTTTTKSISTASYNGNECRMNGFMGDDNDCRKFYRCVENGNGGFTRYEFSCGDGTVWDRNISACNHAWAVDKCGGTMTSNENPNPSTQGSHTITSIQSESTTKITTEYTPSSSSTLSTPTMSDMNNQCVVNGFMANKYDCKKFYRCVDDGKGSFTRYEFTCGEGTVWDPKIEACNYASEVESCGGNAPLVSETSSAHETVTQKDEDADNNYVSQNNQGISSSTESVTWSSSTIKSSTVIDSKQCQTEGFMGDSNDCKKFYRCVNDGKGSFIRYEFSCGEGTVWDSEINACNHMGSVKTPCSSILTSTTNKPSEDYTSPASQASSTSANIDYSSTPRPQKSQQCEQEGFIADIDDCKKFYRCTDNGQGGFHKYEFTCGEGTVWDQEILACNHASSNPNCSSIHSEPQAATTDTSAPHSSISSASVTQSTENTVISSSEDKCVSEGFYANSNDCKKFFRCVGDGKGSFTKYDFTCGDGTIWVQEIQACDHDIDNSHCSKNSIGTATSTQSNNEEVITTTSTSSSSTTTDKSTPAKPNDEYGGQSSTDKSVSTNDNTCQSDGFYPNSNDCKQFYQCVNNGNGGYNKFEFTCAEGAAWDTNTQSCNHINEVKSCQNQADIQTKPIIQDESVSESSSTTDTYSTGSTTTMASNQDNCEESGYYGNSEDCKKFYRCVDNGKGGFTKYDFSCGDGTIWDQDITACNHPQDVSNPSCKNKDSTSTTTSTTTTTRRTESSDSTTKSTSSIDSTTQSTTAENNVSQSTEETSTKKPNNNYTCTEAGFYADPYDCKKFYRCVDWGGDGKTFSIYHFDCGEGTIWDPALQTCNHEDSVYPPRDCSGAQSQTENSNKNDTTTTEGTTSKQEETTEPSTTEKTTTTTQSTTQGSTTTDSSSTEQSSTTDQTSSTQQSTTQQSTTEQTTTQQSTTEKSTTQQSTTEGSTTQQSTTEQSTTQQSTTEQSTTQQSTTEQSTTQQSTTEQSTTQQSTTEQTTSTTTEQTTTTTTEESTTTTAQTTTSESTTTTAEQTTKAEQTTTQESSTEQTSENQSSTTEQSSTAQETTDGTSTTASGQDSTTEKESSDKECPETDDDQYLYVCPTGFRRHPKYCNLFYQCTEDDETHEVKVATFNCPNNTIYDESKIQCVEEDKADKKCEGQIAQKRRVKRLDASYKEPITVSREKYSCPTVGHFPFEKNEECSPALFKCKVTKTGKLRGFVYQCPDGYVYWAISRKCEPITAMTDCKRSFIDWNSRYEIPVERKNVARIK